VKARAGAGEGDTYVKEVTSGRRVWAMLSTPHVVVVFVSTGVGRMVGSTCECIDDVLFD
jgi:hypothetical protein